MDLKDQIENTVRRTVPTLSVEAVEAVATHLLSNEVGVTCVSDLKDVSADFLPKNMGIPLLKQKQLLAAFVNMSTDQGPNQQRNVGQGEVVQVPDPPYRGLPIPQDDEFKFCVQWSQLDKTMIDALDLAKTNKKKAHPKLINELKLGIMKKLVESYKQFQNTHPSVTQKHPGRKIYASITEQVNKRFKGAIFTIINGSPTSDSKKAFLSKLEQSVENKMKKFNKGPRKAVKGSSTIGVILEQYNPPVCNNEEQEGIREHLVNLHDANSDPAAYDWEQVREDMLRSYPLQREDIIDTCKAVQEEKGKENIDPNEEEDEDTDELNPKACEVLIKKWPYLFKIEGLTQHHYRLTRRNLFRLCQGFMNDHLTYFKMFLTSQTSHNTANLIALHKAERAQLMITDQLYFLAILEMLCNVFEYEINTLIFTTEKTTQPDVFQWTVLQTTEYPCIVALDKNMYKAEKYFVCTDKIPLYECKDPAQAVICLFMMCFVLDLEYRKLPKLFEFLERFVFSLGLVDSKVKTTQGKQIQFTSEKVRKFSEDYEQFRVIYLEAMAEGQ